MPVRPGIRCSFCNIMMENFQPKNDRDICSSYFLTLCRYTMENDKLVFYVHGALEGRKLDIIRNNSDCCVQIECDVQPFSGKVACQYGCSYYSFDGFGTAEIVEAPQEKIKAMSALMKIQTGKDFEFNERLVSIVSVIRIECDYYTAKYRPLPANPVV